MNKETYGHLMADSAKIQRELPSQFKKLVNIVRKNNNPENETLLQFFADVLNLREVYPKTQQKNCMNKIICLLVFK